MTSVQPRAIGNRFYVPCTVRGSDERRLLALVDTGASVTAVRGDICDSPGLFYTGTRPATRVHGSHEGIDMKRHLGTLILVERARNPVVYELGQIYEEDVGYFDAILGLNILEGYSAALDWTRMVGTLKV